MIPQNLWSDFRPQTISISITDDKIARASTSRKLYSLSKLSMKGFTKEIFYFKPFEENMKR